MGPCPLSLGEDEEESADRTPHTVDGQSLSRIEEEEENRYLLVSRYRDGGDKYKLVALTMSNIHLKTEREDSNNGSISFYTIQSR